VLNRILGNYGLKHSQKEGSNVAATARQMLVLDERVAKYRDNIFPVGIDVTKYVNVNKVVTTKIIF